MNLFIIHLQSVLKNGVEIVCVPDKVKNMSEKVYNFMSRVSGIKFFVPAWIVCVCKCWLNESECNSKQKWNHDKRRYTCKKLDDYDYCKDDYILNPST